MALNPPLNNNGTPFRLESEYILVERRGMEAQVKVKGMKKLEGKGTVYLTTARMIFVNKNYKKDDFKAIDMPVALIKKPDFKQPIFGSNYLKFDVDPLYNLLPGEADVKLWFTQGGCDKFLRIFEYVSKEVYQQKKNGRMNNNLQKQWQNGFFKNNQGFQDPSDPTVIFSNQPQVFDPKGDYIGNNIYVDMNTDYPEMGEQNNNQGQKNDYKPNVPNYPTLDDNKHNQQQNNQGYPPQNNQGYPPQNNQGYPPQNNQGYPPMNNQGYPPQNNQGYPPQNNQGYPPQNNQGYPPMNNQGYPPQNNQGYPLQNNQGYPPMNNQGYPPMNNQGYPPQNNQGFHNSQQQGFQNQQNYHHQNSYPNQGQHQQNNQQFTNQQQPYSNMPNVQNPYPAQENQTVGHYFGFFGPGLKRGQGH